MSTVKSDNSDITINASGSGRDIKFQANGVEKASISSAGAFTSTTIDATALTGNLPAISGANLTGLSSFNPDGAVTINESGADVDFRVESDTNTHALFVQGSDGNVGIGTTAPILGKVHLLAAGTSDASLENVAHFGKNSTSRAGLQVRANATQVDVGMQAQAGAGNLDLSFSTLVGGGHYERMRIQSGGDIVQGTASTGSDGRKSHWHSSVSSYRSGTADAYHYQFYNNNGAIGRIRTANSTTTYNTSSDYRLKENVNYDWDATTKLKQLKPARFNFISDDTNTLVDGFIAHEVSSVVPEAISGEKDAMIDEEYEVTPAVEEVRDEEGNITTEAVEAVMGTRSVIDPQNIDHSVLVPLLVKTIQELEARITALEA